MIISRRSPLSHVLGIAVAISGCNSENSPPANGPDADVASDASDSSLAPDSVAQDAAPPDDASDAVPSQDADTSTVDSGEDWACVRLTGEDGGQFCRCSIPPPAEGVPIPEKDCHATDNDRSDFCQICGDTCECGRRSSCTPMQFSRTCQREVLCPDDMHLTTGTECVVPGVQCLSVDPHMHLCECDATGHMNCEQAAFPWPDGGQFQVSDWTGDPCAVPGDQGTYLCGDTNPISGLSQWASLCVCEPSLLWFCFAEELYVC